MYSLELFLLKASSPFSTRKSLFEFNSIIAKEWFDCFLKLFATRNIYSIQFCGSFTVILQNLILR